MPSNSNPARSAVRREALLPTSVCCASRALVVRAAGRAGRAGRAGSGFSLLGVDAPEARYIERDRAQLAYQVVGEGGVDVLVVGETAQHFDLCWTDPYIHELFERGASFSRTVYMQPRGFGLSERIRYVPTLEQHAEDVLAVMDAVGMRAATLVGALTTSGVVALAAARAPECVANLVLFKPIACGPLAPDADQHGWSTGAAADYTSHWRSALDRWGSGAVIDAYDPVQGTGYNRRLMAMLERCSATPATARQYWEWFVRLDISDVFRAVRSPTRVLSRRPRPPEPEAVVRRVAELIPRPAFTICPRLPRAQPSVQAWMPVWQHVEEAATGARRSPGADRLPRHDAVHRCRRVHRIARRGSATPSTARCARNARAPRAARGQRSGGRLVSVTGDGTFSLFDGPTDAVRCADEIRKAAEKLGVCGARRGASGELERTGRNFTGLSVHVGARVGAIAAADEVLVSRAVYDLVAGSGLAFVKRGERTLKGVPGSWHCSRSPPPSSRRRCQRSRSTHRSTVPCLPPLVPRPERCAPSCESATRYNAIAPAPGPVAPSLLSRRPGLLRLTQTGASPRLPSSWTVADCAPISRPKSLAGELCDQGWPVTHTAAEPHRTPLQQWRIVAIRAASTGVPLAARGLVERKRWHRPMATSRRPGFREGSLWAISASLPSKPIAKAAPGDQEVSTGQLWEGRVAAGIDTRSGCT